MRTKAKSAVPTLTKTLTDSDLEVRVYAASALVQMKEVTPTVFPILTSALTSQNDPAKYRSLETLRGMGKAATPAIPALLKILKNPNSAADTYTRTQAAELLAQIGADAQLIAALKDPAPIIRWRAAYALGQMKAAAKTVVPALITALLEDPHVDVRRRAADALGNIGTAAKTAVPALITALEDPHVDVRRRAAEALGNMGTEAKTAIPALTATTKDRDKWVSRNAEEALRQIDSAQKAVNKP
jgi:HEAT repeat protein